MDTTHDPRISLYVKGSHKLKKSIVIPRNSAMNLSLTYLTHTNGIMQC
jgi:hypothetical protein